MLIKLPNADFSASGLGQATPYINGMPATDLVGLYLMMDGDVGENQSILADSSGFGNHAVLKSGWTPMKRQSYGMGAVDVDGSVYEIPQDVNLPGRSFTAIVAAKSRLLVAESGVYNTYFGGSEGIGATNEDSNVNDPALAINYNMTTSPAKFQVFDGLGDMLAATTTVNGTTALGTPGIFAMSVDVPGNEVTANRLGASSIVTTAGDGSEIADFYDGVTPRGNMVIGCWPQVTRSAQGQPLAEVYAVAIYSTVMTFEAGQAHMSAMQSIIEARGITGF